MGVYLDAAPGVKARAIQVLTPTPGFSAAIYAANQFQNLPYGNTAPLTQRGWSQLAPSQTIAMSTRIALHPSSALRYYLVWVVKLPPGHETAELAEVTLFR